MEQVLKMIIGGHITQLGGYHAQKAKIVAPAFDGTYDHQIFSDWIADMGHFLIGMIWTMNIGLNLLE